MWYHLISDPDFSLVILLYPKRWEEFEQLSVHPIKVPSIPTCFLSREWIGSTLPFNNKKIWEMIAYTNLENLKKKWIFKLLENEKEKKITSPRFFFLFFISFHFYFFVFVCAFKIYLLVALLSLFPFFFSFFLFWYNLFPASSPMKCHSTLLPRLCCCYIAKGDTRYILSSLVRPLILLSFRDAVVYILWSPHLRHPSPSSLFSLVRFGLWTLISSIRCDDASLIFSIKKRRRGSMSAGCLKICLTVQ